MSECRIILRPKCDLCQAPAHALVRVSGGCTCFTNEYQRRCRQHLERLADTDEYEIMETYFNQEVTVTVSRCQSGMAGRSGKRMEASAHPATMKTTKPLRGECGFESRPPGKLTNVSAEMLDALREIADMQPRPHTGEIPFSDEWDIAVAQCPECQGWAKNHPIQRGICDTHRKPIWAMERHSEEEEKAFGCRMRAIAMAAIQSTANPPKSVPGA